MKRRPLTIEERNRISQSAKANPDWAILHAKPDILYVWTCPGCGKEMERYSPPSPAGYCALKCHANTKEYVETSKVKANRAFREQFKESSLSLYSQGIGCKSIAAKIGTTHKIVRKILIEAGVYAPNPFRNGFARKGSGEHSRIRLKEKGRKWAVIQMNWRVKKCLDKKPPRTTAKRTGAPLGLSDAKYAKWRYDNDPQYLMRELLRQRMRKLIKRGMKSGSTLELVGCGTAQVRAHIESQFKKGMSWDNHGTGKGKWHVDHIVPCAAFDLTIPSQQRTCFHYTNLRPLWSIDNIKKGDTINHLNNQLGLAI